MDQNRPPIYRLLSKSADLAARKDGHIAGLKPRIKHNVSAVAHERQPAVTTSAGEMNHKREVHTQRQNHRPAEQTSEIQTVAASLRYNYR